VMPDMINDFLTCCGADQKNMLFSEIFPWLCAVVCVLTVLFCHFLYL
jgi:hypothetical protein